MGKIYRHVERKRNISRKGSFPRSVYYGKIKSDGFVLPSVCSPASTGEHTPGNVDPVRIKIYSQNFMFLKVLRV